MTPSKMCIRDSWYTGRKVGEIWGYRAEGLIQTQEEADAYNAEYDLSYILSLIHI